MANFNETEQLLLVEDQQSSGQRAFDDFSHKLSFVQIRGSVPVFWAEINTLRYKPDLQVMDLQDTVSVNLAYFNSQLTYVRRMQCVFIYKNKYLFTENSIWSV